MCSLHELRVIFIARVISLFLHTSCKLLFLTRVTNYFLHVSCEILFVARVTSYFYYKSFTFIARLTSFLFHTSYGLLFIVRVSFLVLFIFSSWSLVDFELLYWKFGHEKFSEVTEQRLNLKLKWLVTVRSNRPEVFCKNVFLKNFVKFTGKHLYLQLY